MLPDLANLDRLVVSFTLVFFRVAGLMLIAPLFGSARVPARFKIMIALVMAMAMLAGGVPTDFPLPESIGRLTVGLIAEIAFGLTMGLVVSLVFIAAQWAGEMAGQQVGLNMSQVLDPQFGGGGSIVSELYFMLATAAFLLLDGHRLMVLGIYESLVRCPPLSVLIDASLFEFLLKYLSAATALALRIAAPMFVTMIVVDVAMGCISKTVPQLNVMSAGMAVRGILGMVVLALGIGTVGMAIGGALGVHLKAMHGLLR